MTILGHRLNFLEYYDVQSIEGYPTESFSLVVILENNGDSSFQNSAEKLYGCHGNIHEG